MTRQEENFNGRQISDADQGTATQQEKYANGQNSSPVQDIPSVEDYRRIQQTDPMPSHDAVKRHQEYPVGYAGSAKTQHIGQDGVPYPVKSQAGYFNRQRNGLNPQKTWMRFPGVKEMFPVTAERQIWYELCGFSLLLFLLAAFNAIFIYPLVTQDASLYTNSIEDGKNFGLLFYHGLAAPWPEQLIPHFSWSPPETWLVRGLLVISLILLLTFMGRTPGGILGGYKTVNLGNGRQPDIKISIGYYATYLLASIFPAPFIVSVVGIILWLSPLFESKSGWSRGLFYRLFGLVAIDVRQGRDAAGTVPSQKAGTASSATVNSCTAHKIT